MPNAKFLGDTDVTYYGERYQGVLRPGQVIEVSDADLERADFEVTSAAVDAPVVDEEPEEVGSSPPAPTADNDDATESEE